MFREVSSVNSFISERVSCIIIAGGIAEGDTIAEGHAGPGYTDHVELLTRELPTKKLPNLPKNINHTSMVLHNGTVLICGGFEGGVWIERKKKCLQLDQGTWKEHSTLNEKRLYHSTVTTPTATFVFGGRYSEFTFEYLPKDSTTWILGRTQIPDPGFEHGCAIAVKSGQEILLIGGLGPGNIHQKRIISFNVADHTFRVMTSELNVARSRPQCALIPNTNKVMITGGDGFVEQEDGILNSTEIFNTEDGSVTMASPLNTKRTEHGMGVFTINCEYRLAVLGGHDGFYVQESMLDSVELYNTKTGKWENSVTKLTQPNCNFLYLTVKLSDIISELNK